jgi:hypothetical protein
MSYMIAKDRGIKPYATILEHIGIAVIVMIGSNYVGQLLINKFKF